MSHSMPEPTGSAASGSSAPAEPSVGDLVKAMSADLSRLVRNEMQLAQTEISAKAKQAGKGVGALGGAGVLALYGLAVLIALLVSAALAVLYRVAPDRDAPKMRWVSVGAVVATVLWLLASAGFSLYVANFGSYAKTYGAFAGILWWLMWCWFPA